MSAQEQNMNSINFSLQAKKKLALLLGLGLSWGSVGLAFLLQLYYQLNPCPLCILSRIILIGIGFIFCCWLVQSFFGKKSGNWLYFLLTSLSLAGGLILSSYHVWLMLLPSERLPSCGPDLNYLLETLPLKEVFIEVFKGSGNCAHDTWRLLGLNLAQLQWGIYFMLVILHFYIWKKIKSIDKTRGV